MAIYNGKHVVFEQVGCESNDILWNQSNNLDSDNASNDWNISDMRNTNLPAKLLVISSNLQGAITNTTIQTATNGNNGTLVSTSDKLFLAAEKEMSVGRNNSRTEEFSALTTWNYWTTHTQRSDRVKYDTGNTARGYWLRSPSTGYTDRAVGVGSSGYFVNNPTNFVFSVSLCYAF